MRGRLATGAAAACLTMLVAVPHASADDNPMPRDSLLSGGAGQQGVQQAGPGIQGEHLMHGAPLTRGSTGTVTARRGGDWVTAVPCGPDAGAALQHAVETAHSGDTLRLTRRCDYRISTPDPSHPDSGLYVDKSLTIEGNGAVISRAGTAGSDFRVFRIDSPGSLRLSHATVRGGRATAPTTDSDGGGFEVNGSGAALTLEATRVTGNLSQIGGGGIANYGGVLKMTGGLLFGNTSGNGGAGLEQGAGSATFRRSLIAHNTSDASLFGVFAAGGGGIRMVGSGSVTLIGTPLTSNRAIHGYTFGGAIENIFGHVTITHSPLAYNAADGDGARGGAVSNLDTLHVTSSPMIHNTATGTATGGTGGALSNDNGANPTTVIRWSPIADNTASGPGAAGGGIFVHSGHVTTSGLVRNNVPDNCRPLGTVTGCFG